MGEYAELALEQEMETRWPTAFGNFPPRINRYVEFREHNDKFWLTKDLRTIRMSDMTLSHLQNSKLMLERNNQTYTKAYSGLVAEIKERQKDVD